MPNDENISPRKYGYDAFRSGCARMSPYPPSPNSVEWLTGYDIAEQAAVLATMPIPDTRPVVTEEDIALRKDLLRYMVSVLGEPCSDGDMPDDRNDELDRIIARHRIAAEPRVSAREEVAAKAIRSSFFTSVSGEKPHRYHLSLAYQTMDEMHAAEDAIKAWAKSVLETKA